MEALDTRPPCWDFVYHSGLSGTTAIRNTSHLTVGVTPSGSGASTDWYWDSLVGMALATP